MHKPVAMKTPELHVCSIIIAHPGTHTSPADEIANFDEALRNVLSVVSVAYSKHGLCFDSYRLVPLEAVYPSRPAATLAMRHAYVPTSL